MTSMSGEVRHQRIKSNGLWLHVAEQGSSSDPLVLLLHGFPESWYSWRHQIPYLASHGYHVVAPDMRGYGDSDSPLSPTSYTVFHLCGDILGLLDHFGQQKAFVVGHDWGAIAARYLALFRPDRLTGLVLLNVPVSPVPKIKYVDHFRQLYGDDFYICQFQEPGRSERAFARYDYLTVMKKFLLITNSDMIAPPGMEVIDFLETPALLPAWITEEDLQVYADKFEESGFTGPLNYYRAMDLNWELLAAWDGCKITVPTKFIVGGKDIGYELFGTKAFVEGGGFRQLVQDLEVVVLDGHHFLQQERPSEVSQEILSFLSKFPKICQ